MESPDILCLDGSHCPTFTVCTQATGHWCWVWATWEQPTGFWTVASCSLCSRQTCKRWLMLSLVVRDPVNQHSVKIFVEKCPNFMWRPFFKHLLLINSEKVLIGTFSEYCNLHSEYRYHYKK